MYPRHWGWIALCCLANATVFAADSSLANMRAEIEQLRKELAEKKDLVKDVETKIDSRFGPNSPAFLKSDDPAIKLVISGLVQIWYQSIQNDNRGITKSATTFNPDAIIGAESNEGNDNDTFRIRRTELRFSFDVTKSISAYFMIDPARAHNPSFYPLPTLPRHNTLSSNFPLLQTGQITDNVPRLLQDAYVNIFDVLPNHFFTIGQFKPPSGFEASRSTDSLDFVERAMVSGINNVRDLGVGISGLWLEGRLRYELGLFNGPTGTVLSDPEIVEAGNRSDDNDEKDFAWRIIYQPIWDAQKWYGRLELGYTRTDGIHGESGQEFDPDFSLNAINLSRTSIWRQGAWAWYRPGGPVRGWWFRGEWGAGHDRYGAGALTSLLGIGSVDLGQDGPRGGNGFTQGNPEPVTVGGWYFATGYKMSDSRFADKLKEGGKLSQALLNLEFLFRYETYQNVAMEDLVRSDRETDQFKTQVWTFGVNYFMMKHNSKIQANYMWVNDPSSGNEARGLREVRNDVFVVNFQFGF